MSGSATAVKSVDAGNTHVDSIAALEFVNQSLTSLPSGIGALLENIIFMSIDGTPLETITAADLKQFPKLEYFDLSNTQVASLNGNLFAYTPNLKTIMLDNNKIDHVAKNLIKDLLHLQYFTMENNPCSQPELTSRAAIEFLQSTGIKCPELISTTVSPCADLEHQLAAKNLEIENLTKEVVDLRKNKADSKKRFEDFRACEAKLIPLRDF